MDQARLLQIATGLKLGEAINLPEQDVYQAAKGELNSLLLDTLRREDVDRFIEKVKQNWGVELVPHPYDGTYTMHKIAVR